jgi:hypothetical protein
VKERKPYYNCRGSPEKQNKTESSAEPGDRADCPGILFVFPEAEHFHRAGKCRKFGLIPVAGYLCRNGDFCPGEKFWLICPEEQISYRTESKRIVQNQNLSETSEDTCSG